MKHPLAIAALVVTSISLATALPVMAQDQAATPVAKRSDREIHRSIARDMGPGRGAGLLGLVCSDKGAEALEIAFVRWSHRLDLTAEQQALFDTLKAKALTTQTSFADTCQAAMPDRSADTKPDLLESLKARLTVEEAKLTALNAVLPDFEAFYGSLSDEQKASLMPGGMGPRDGGPGDRMGRGFGSDRNTPDRTHRMPAPGRG